MGFFRSSGKYVSEKAQGHSAQVSKETNKALARDPHVPADARLRAGFRSWGDRFKERGHKHQAKVNKHAAKHNY